MTRRGRIAGVLGAAVLTASSLLLALPTTAGAGTGEPMVRVGDPPSLRSATPWVRAGGTWTAVFDPTGLDPRGFVDVHIHTALRGTDAEVTSRLQRQSTGRDLGGVVDSLPTHRLLELARPDGTVAIDISIATNGGSAAGVDLPGPGVYPVAVTFSDGDGRTVADRLLYLVLDTDARAADPSNPATPGGPTTTADQDASTEPYPAVRTVVLVTIETEPAFDRDGAPRVEIARQAARRALDVLGGAATGGVCTLVRAEVLEALGASPDPEDQTLLNELIDALRATRALRAPWAPLHTDGWITAGGAGEVARSMVASQDTSKLLARQILDPRIWPPDETLDNSSLAGLGRLGVNQLLVDDDRLAPGRLPRGERGYNRPIRVGSSASSMPAMVSDPAIVELLRSGDDPAWVVNQVIARVSAQTLAVNRQRGARASRGALVVVNDDVPTAVASPLIAALGRSGGPVSITPPEGLFDRVAPLRSNADGTGAGVTRSLRSASTIGAIDTLVSQLPRAWARGEAARRMRPPNDPLGTRVRVSLLGATRRGQSSPQRLELLTRAIRTTDETLSAVSMPSKRTVTVTSRSATIPLRVTNDADAALRVRVRFASSQLEFEGGADRELVLEPGVNRLEVPVRVRSSGEFVLRISMLSPADSTTPGDGIELQSSTVTVRSTAFSGVGLILSGGALLVLVVWWGRTLRRDRRRTLPGDATTAH